MTGMTTPTRPDIAWHISTYSDGASANCVEVGPILDDSDRVAVRDSTRRTAGTLTANRAAWTALTTALHVGHLTHG